MAASISDQLETKLSDIFGRNAPKMPENGRKWLVKYMPWITLVVGLISLWLAQSLWVVAHTLSTTANAINQFSALYGGPVTVTPDMSLTVWLALVVLVAEALLYIAAFPGLRDHRKAGWNLLYWAALLNVVYAVVVFFTDYDGFTRFIVGLIGSAIGLWVLFQMRSAYGEVRVSKSHAGK